MTDHTRAIEAGALLRDEILRLIAKNIKLDWIDASDGHPSIVGYGEAADAITAALASGDLVPASTTPDRFRGRDVKLRRDASRLIERIRDGDFRFLVTVTAFPGTEMSAEEHQLIIKGLRLMADDLPVPASTVAAQLAAERERCAQYIEQRDGSIPERQEIAREIRALEPAPASGEQPATNTRSGE